jgi:hypothetical protein
VATLIEAGEGAELTLALGNKVSLAGLGLAKTPLRLRAGCAPSATAATP